MYRLEVDCIRRDDWIDKKSDCTQMYSLPTAQNYNLGHLESSSLTSSKITVSLYMGLGS